MTKPEDAASSVSASGLATRVVADASTKDAPLVDSPSSAADSADSVPLAPPRRESSPSGRVPRWRLPLLMGVLVVLAGLAALERYYRWRNSSERRVARALAALDADDWGTVEREYLELPSTTALEPVKHFFRGALLLRGGNPEAALGEFGDCRDAEVLKNRPYALAGQALYQVGDMRSAQHLLSQVVATEPENVDAHRWLGAIYYDLGAASHAIAALERVAKLAPRDPRPHRLIALINKDYERFDIATEAYQEALRRMDLGPSDHRPGPDGKPRPLQLGDSFRQELLLEWSECEVKLRRYETAMRLLDQCAPSPEREVLQAECHYSLGEAAAARNRLDKALATAPDNLQALTLLGTLTLEAGDTELAMKTLQHAVAVHPKDFTVRFKYVQALQQLGRTAEAEQQGKIADELRNLRREFAELHQRASREPSNAEIRYELGVMAERLDRPDLAQSWYRATLTLDPQHAAAQKKLTPRSQGEPPPTPPTPPAGP